MADGHEPDQLSNPPTLTVRPENVSISRFQIVFGVETNRGQGTMTCRAPEHEYVRQRSGSHNSSFDGRKGEQSPSQSVITSFQIP
jgi:hypothetical protein